MAIEYVILDLLEGETLAARLERCPLSLLQAPRRGPSMNRVANECPGVGLLLAWTLVLLGTSPLLAQQDDPLPRPHVTLPDTPPPTFKTTRIVVTVDAVVTDGNGRHVTDLTPGDFEVTVGNKRQELQQAIYVRTVDQSRVLSVATSGAPVPASAPPDVHSSASLALKRTGLQPDRIARTIALVVDDLGLSFRGTVETRAMLHKYIDTQMEPGDLVAIVRTGGGTGTLQQFTTDRRLLHRAADGVLWNFLGRPQVSSFRAVEPTGLPGSVAESGPGTVPSRSGSRGVADAKRDTDAGDLRDAIASVGSLGALEYVARGIAELPGRKCIVFVSEGFTQLFVDRSESGRIWRALSRMLGQVNAAGVVLYTIDARGLATGGLTAEDNPQQTQTGRGGTYDAEALVRNTARSRQDALLYSQESMQFIANQTGGFAITNTNDLNLGLRRVLDDQQGYYLLGYAAPEDAPRSGWDQNRVKVRVKRSGLRIRARQGFFGPSDTNEPKRLSDDGLTNAALSPFSSTGITARLTTVFGHDTRSGAYVRSVLFVDTNDLRFEEEQPARHTATFQLAILAIGDNGRVLAQWQRLVPVALNDQQLQLAKARGIVYSLRMMIKEPGGYQLRAAVRDVNTTLTGSASQFLDVPKVGPGQLALSGVLLKGLADAETASADATEPAIAADGLAEAVLLEPEVRVLQPGTDAVYAYEIYDGLDPKKSSGLEMGTALLREGHVVYQSPFSPVTAAPRGHRKVRAIPIAGKLALGTDMPAGPYTLEVTVRANDAKKLERRQWLDFEIRR
jgi:VWFA-related protein